MSMKLCRRLAVSSILLLFGCANRSVRSRVLHIRTLEDKLAQDDSITTAESARQLNEAYRHLLKEEIQSDRLRVLDDESLRELFNAVRIVLLHTEGTDQVQAGEQIFLEMTRRKIEDARQAKELYRGYVVSQQFDKARHLGEKYALLDSEPLPQIHESSDLKESSLLVFDVSDDASSLAVRSLPWGRSPAIIMASSPVCSPSGRAREDILADPRLKAAFEGHAILLGPAETTLYPKELARWNREHPTLRNFILYRKSDALGLELNETPIFYFFNKGKLRYTVHGWERSGKQKAELLNGLALIGL